MRTKVFVALLIAAAITICTWGEPDAREKAPRLVVVEENAEPFFPAAVFPSIWGRVIGFASQGGAGYGSDASRMVLEAEDGTLRILIARGGAWQLCQVIHRSEGKAVPEKTP